MIKLLKLFDILMLRMSKRSKDQKLILNKGWLTHFKASQLNRFCDHVRLCMLCTELVSKEKALCLVNVEALLTCSRLVVSPTPCGLLLPLDSPKMTLFRFVFLFGTLCSSSNISKGTDLQLKKNQKGVKLFMKIIRGTRFTLWPETNEQEKVPNI